MNVSLLSKQSRNSFALLALSFPLAILSACILPRDVVPFARRPFACVLRPFPGGVSCGMHCVRPVGEAHGSGDRPFFHAADLRRSLSGGHHVLVGHGRSGYCGTSADCIRCSGHYRVRPQHAGGLGCMGAAADAHRLCEGPVQCCGGVGGIGDGGMPALSFGGGFPFVDGHHAGIRRVRGRRGRLGAAASAS